MNTLLLLIDPQTDFHDIPSTISEYQPKLPIHGSWQDALRLAAFINAPESNITDIFVTLDSHEKVDISHPTYWIDTRTGTHPAPFTQITIEDYNKGLYQVTNMEKVEHARRYLSYLDSNDKLTHTIFNEHCLVGTEGHGIVAPIKHSIDAWESRTGKAPTLFNKGENPDYEFFGPFEAQMLDSSSPDTFMKIDLILELISSYDAIYITGQALSHCVGTGMLQIIDVIETVIEKEKQADALSKLHFIKNTTSSVTGFESVGENILQKLKDKGISLIDI